MTKHTVLVVDDQEDIRVLVASILRAVGYEVLLAQDGASAMVVARHKDPDAIILDIGLPAGDGLAVLERMRAAGSPTPVIVLTGKEGAAPRERAEGLGISGYFRKPVDRDRLLEALRVAIRESERPSLLIHCPQCGWAIPMADVDTDILEALVKEIRSRA